jgi:hypothetical protein
VVLKAWGPVGQCTKNYLSKPLDKCLDCHIKLIIGKNLALKGFGMSEEWRAVRRFEGRYEVSNTGDVRSLLRSGRTLIPEVLFNHRHVTLSMPGGLQRKAQIADLVLEAFVELRPEGMQSRHKVNGTNDDSVGNLYWAPKKLRKESR